MIAPSLQGSVAVMIKTNDKSGEQPRGLDSQEAVGLITDVWNP